MAAILKIKDLNNSIEFSLEHDCMSVRTFNEDEDGLISPNSEIQFDKSEVNELIEFLQKSLPKL
ncbi:hypothetical protein G7050_02835 [Dysgonomonas sp. HDW5A]|uniref:hypothetical protein n=1 Tax=Dysgonomonas sp. HDW5A TaxID=2714926 RepID=UPI001407770B|nr:hypothetical protein [Dysgonomonas sp. HDW5A]QIK58832.1 hypothetical protein G7050_02835 [Dysgonomonas sp. HDW5A]